MHQQFHAIASVTRLLLLHKLLQSASYRVRSAMKSSCPSVQAILLPCTVILLTISCSMQMCPSPSVENVNYTKCVSKEKAINESIIHPGCHDWVVQPYIYMFLKDYSCLNDLLQDLHDALRASPMIEPICNETLTGYFCNYVYPGCDPESEINLPIGICQGDCIKYVLGEQCKFQIDLLAGLGMTTGDFNFPVQCDNTLLFVEDSGLSVNASEDNCTSLSSVIVSGIDDITTETAPEIIPLEAYVYIVPVCVVVFLVTLLVLGGLVLSFYIRRKRTKTGNLLEPSSDQPSNYYHRASQDGGQPEDAVLFQLSVNDLMDNQYLRKALVPFNQLKIMEEIGFGAFGLVYEGLFIKKTEDDEEELEAVKVAVKTIKNSTGSYSELKGFIEESTLMCGFDHPNVLGLVGICLDSSNSPYLLLPFMENGDLKYFLKKKREQINSPDMNFPEGLSEVLLLRMCSDIADGMKYLALQKLVHRDLAARNCMIDKDLSVRVADFGLTRDIYETNYYRQHHRSRIPIKWMAPESLNDRISNQKTDVWSYGVTCWEVFSLGRTPYPTVQNVDMLEYLETGRRLKQPNFCPNPMYSLMKSCWEEKPELRPTFAEISRILTTKILPQATSAANNKPPADTEETQILEGDDESLFNSIVGSLPDNFKKMHWDLDIASPENGRRSDYYTHINPRVIITRPRDRSENDYYNQTLPMSASVGANGWTKHSEGSPDRVAYVHTNGNAYSDVPKKAGVKRSVSNVSAYLDMDPAEPAKADDRRATH